jgi:hypothetical protein
MKDEDKCKNYVNGSHILITIFIQCFFTTIKTFVIFGHSIGYLMLATCWNFEYIKPIFLKAAKYNNVPFHRDFIALCK